MVDDNFVAAVGAQGGLYRLGNCTTGFNVAYNGTVFGFVATDCQLGLRYEEESLKHTFGSLA